MDVLGNLGQDAQDSGLMKLSEIKRRIACAETEEELRQIVESVGNQYRQLYHQGLLDMEMPEADFWLGVTCLTGRKQECLEEFDGCFRHIKPLVEFCPVNQNSLGFDEAGEPFLTCEAYETLGRDICSMLEEATGVFLLYGSARQVLYAGLAKKQSLWREMSRACNDGRHGGVSFFSAYQIECDLVEEVYLLLTQGAPHPHQPTDQTGD